MYEFETENGLAFDRSAAYLHWPRTVLPLLTPSTLSMSKPLYDLEDRTFAFGQRVRTFVRSLPRTLSNNVDMVQLIRSSGSVGANYIEANDSLGRKDFLLHIRICRKESKETRYWLRLVDTRDDNRLDSERQRLAQEATELMNIFGAILRKSE